MKKTIFTLLLCCISFLSFANGGPVDGSSVVSIGDMRLLNNPLVKLQKEKLTIEVQGEYCLYKVEYTLQNTSAKNNEAIKYGFPVDFAQDEFSESFEWDDDYIKDLHFTLDGKKLDYQSQEDVSLITRSIDNLELNETYEVNVKRKWFLTEFNIGHNKTAVLKVQYLAKSNFTDFATSKSYYTYYGEKNVYWDFTPAQYWGDGIVDDFEVNILLKKGAIDEDSFQAKGLPFTKQGENYYYSSKKFDLAQANPILLSYTDTDLQMDKLVRSSNVTSSGKILGIKASSFKKGYPAKHVADADYSTTWVPQKDGIGEWVEIETAPFHLGSIIVVGGYTKSEEAYYNNNRPKKLRLDYVMEGYVDEEDSSGTIEMELPDSINVSKVPNSLFANFSENGKIDPVVDWGDGGFGKLKKMRITILDIYKGKKYNDTCISEVLLLGYDWGDMDDE